MSRLDRTTKTLKKWLPDRWQTGLQPGRRTYRLIASDETDGDSFRICDMIFGKLYDFTYGTATVEPSLAEKCTANADMTVWTCTLKKM